MNDIYKKKYLKYKIKYQMKLLGGNKINYLKFNDINDIIKDELKIDNQKKTFNYYDFQVRIKNNILTLNYINNDNDSCQYTKYDLTTFKNYYGYTKIINKIIKNLIYNNSNKNFKILVLGFGLGGLPLHFSNFDNIINIDTVDIDEKLFPLFKFIVNDNKFFNNNFNKINFIKMDAINYLKYTDRKYDIIIDDIFLGCNKIDYDYNLVYQRLNKNGLFLSNVHYKINDYVKKLKNNNFKNVTFYHDNEFILFGQK